VGDGDNRGYDVDVPWVAATPQLRRGHSVGHGDNRGYDVDIPWVAATPRL